MEIQQAQQQANLMLRSFLEARNDAESQRALQRLLAEHAEPIIKGVLRRKGRSPARSGGAARQTQEEQDADDLYGEIVAQLLARLRELRTTPGEEPIADIRGYIAVMAFRACDRVLREKYPQRWSLKNKLRYLLSHQMGFALWPNERGETLCGFTVWQKQAPSAPPGARLQQLQEDPRPFLEAMLPRENVRYMPPADLVGAIFSWIGHPVELEDLVGAVAALWNIKDQPTQSLAERALEGGGDPYERIEDPHANVAETVDQRAYLEWLWTEVCQLPPRQCAALLLNLRDTQGRGIIALLPLAKIATMRQIAAAIGMPAEEFAALWKDLPLEDAVIAAKMGLTRQQVINLRKVARERLARRRQQFEKTV